MLPAILPLFPKVKAMFQDKVRQEEIIRRSNLDWIIVRPARLTDVPGVGTYKVGAPLHIGLNAKIGRADVADFILKQVSDNSYLHKVPCVRY